MLNIYRYRQMMKKIIFSNIILLYRIFIERLNLKTLHALIISIFYIFYRMLIIYTYGQYNRYHSIGSVQIQYLRLIIV